MTVCHYSHFQTIVSPTRGCERGVLSSDQTPGLGWPGPGPSPPRTDSALPLRDPRQERRDQGATPRDDEDQECGKEHQHLQRGQRQQVSEQNCELVLTI